MRHTRWNALFGRKARRVVLAGGLGFLRLGLPPTLLLLRQPAEGRAGLPAGHGHNHPAQRRDDDRPPLRCSRRQHDQRDSSARSTTVSDGRKSRVVVSEPSSSRSSSFGWRPSDPEASPAITQVDGGPRGLHGQEVTRLPGPGLSEPGSRHAPA